MSVPFNTLRQRRADRAARDAAFHLAPVRIPEDAMTDPASEFYVAEHLREFYTAATDPEAEAEILADERNLKAVALLALRRRLAADPRAWEAVLNRESSMASPTHPWMQPSRLERLGPMHYNPPGGITSEQVESLTAEDVAAWVHSTRLASATLKHTEAVREQERAAAHRAAITCAVCGCVGGARRYYIYLDAAMVSTSRDGSPDRVALLCGPDRVALVKSLEARALTTVENAGDDRSEALAAYIAAAVQS